jgi:tetratricopeptide (TPR) repeat protein
MKLLRGWPVAGLLLALLIFPPVERASAVEITKVGRLAEARRDRLFEQLKNAKTETEGRALENAIWEMWMAEAPTPEIARTVKAAMDAREAYDYDRALMLIDSVVATAPAYAEGWNQRAFIRFLKEDLDGALDDLDRALELEPRHFGALAGKAIILMQQGRMELGQKALREAVEIHPWLKERPMLVPAPDGPSPQPKGRDI